MIIGIIILAILLAAATAFIFWLLKVLKNTLNITETLLDKPLNSLTTAYDGKYYPAHVILQAQYESPYNGRIVDWSMYDSHKIVGFTILMTEKFEEFYSEKEIAKMLNIPVEEISEEILEIVKNETLKPKMIKNVLVYAVEEDEWIWKPME